MEDTEKITREEELHFNQTKGIDMLNQEFVEKMLIAFRNQDPHEAAKKEAEAIAKIRDVIMRKKYPNWYITPTERD